MALASGGDEKMDDSSSGRTSLADSASLTNSSMRSGASSQNVFDNSDGMIRVFNYLTNEYERFYPSMLCEEICNAMCRQLSIAPTAQLLYGIREHSTSRRPAPQVRLELTWALPGERLSPQLVYVFRMRFRVPELDSQLELIDGRSHKFLYAQMRYDMRNELILEIRYPEHKDKSTGLAVMDMLIDDQEQTDDQQAARSIEKLYKLYLPPSLWRAHSFFVGSKIREVFRNLKANSPNVERLKWHYVHQVSHLAPTYMTEQFTCTVQYLPNEEMPRGGAPISASLAHTVSNSTSTLASSGSTNTLATLTASSTHSANGGGGSGKKGKRRSTSSGIDVYVRVFPHDSLEPGLKVARVTSEATLKWILVGGVEGIFMISKISDTDVRLEIVGLPKGYEMHFRTEKEMKSFISYLGIYIRLSSKWMQDLCHSYRTPSLEELSSLYCHGPIGGAYSLMKLHENGDKCGSYIVRECDREYNIYYIDINTKIIAKKTDQERCKTETFRIVRKDSQWKLTYNNAEHVLNSLHEVAHCIQADSPDRFRIPASKYDKPPLLLLLLPKNLKAKKTDLQLSEAELQRRNPQIFNPKTDLQWYPDSISLSDDGMMFTMRGDWIQQSPVKDVSVTMKMLKSDGNFMEFFRLAQTWSLIQSPQFLKLYGLTLADPYTMVMEYSRYGPLNKFLHSVPNVSLHCLLDLMHGFVRGMHYLEDNKIIHNYIRCSNLYVTKYDPNAYVLDAKISDPGYPRPYRESDSPWIPTKYYRNLQAAKLDQNTQLWAFATTIYEIFSRCKDDLRRLRQDELIRQRNLDGNILKTLDPDICPSLIFETIMDGWSDDEDKRFRHHELFSRLNTIKAEILPNYMPPPEIATNGTGDEEVVEKSADLPCHYPFPGSHMLMVIPLTHECRVIYNMANKIGQGHYGTVYKGHLEFNDKDQPREQVAIKMLNTTQVSTDFQREIGIMRNLDHPNVVRFKYWAEKSHCIIMEYLSGSFDNYLRFEAPNLKDPRLVGFALDIAHGMKYLSGMGLIHRDLAARNILVDHNGDGDRVKISDFGLAQFANSDGYYYAKSKRDIPIKWYSPEAISTCRFSSYSDVWSYGVTLFEMFSRGEVPNLVPMQTSQEDFLNRLQNGERLNRPISCPDFMYDLMLLCWHATPRSRPSFATIVEIITREVATKVVQPADGHQSPPNLPPEVE
ncbi:LOW QUALITY PROTEIN: tyrosine-protein kinase hopscotch [Drosophila ficusphila]|uniref:LOW QUALITY PROTEIN: tyrosine-protein kinase hopscotch n=1 Tax=Drosophila ficusphila TaxID=30025 RepID=UPI0007E7DD50|nr:LOW QUALITY PROTEIN: tyrosine-protein kinase hopscotch [Drosophila ficusphila]